jgi:type 1 glutamine amidotransferase
MRIGHSNISLENNVVNNWIEALDFTEEQYYEHQQLNINYVTAAAGMYVRAAFIV